MNELIQKIRSARYGEEIRDTLANAMLHLYAMMVREIVIEEVIDARGKLQMVVFNGETLGERLDKEEALLQEIETILDSDPLKGRYYLVTGSWRGEENNASGNN